MYGTDRAGSRPKDQIKMAFYTALKTSKDWASVINSAGKRGADKDHSSVIGEGAHDSTYLTELVVAASSDQTDILRKTELLVNCHTKVTNHGQEGNAS